MSMTGLILHLWSLVENGKVRHRIGKCCLNTAIIVDCSLSGPANVFPNEISLIHVQKSRWKLVQISLFPVHSCLWTKTIQSNKCKRECVSFANALFRDAMIVDVISLFFTLTCHHYHMPCTSTTGGLFEGMLIIFILIITAGSGWWARDLRSFLHLFITSISSGGSAFFASFSRRPNREGQDASKIVNYGWFRLNWFLSSRDHLSDFHQYSLSLSPLSYLIDDEHRLLYKHRLMSVMIVQRHPFVFNTSPSLRFNRLRCMYHSSQGHMCER